MNILTINAGSSSIKYRAYSRNGSTSNLLLSGLIEGIGEKEGHWTHKNSTAIKEKCHFRNHSEAFDALDVRLKKDLQDYPIQGTGHRVVHGGTSFYEPTVITDTVLTKIQDLAVLAPLHNPINALGIEYAREHFKAALHVAVFDTGFHHTMPEPVSQYAIDCNTAKEYQIRRYGFHGINHQYVAKCAADFLKKPLSECHFISLHLGNGASACLVKNGKSFDTSMGMTPLAGLIMGTRSGDIDPAIPLYLMRQGFSLSETDDLLNRQSGLKGICQENDMRHILQRYEAGDEQAKLAVAMYVYAIQKTIGAYLSQTGELDALIFTGGVGENAALIREKILTPLSHMGFQIDLELNQKPSDRQCFPISKKGKAVLVIRGDEEESIANCVSEAIQAHFAG